ncbi:MAG: hypothetical protein ACI865_000033 [Flavobacteriaceae bacterium]|jgi:hypothetical protein
MKKIYLSLAVAALSVTGATAQQVITELSEPGFAVQRSVKGDRPSGTLQEFLSTRSVLWNETFDVPGTSPISTNGPTFATSNGVWTAGGVDGQIWKHSYVTTDGEWSTGTPIFASTTASDGFMLFDSDSVNFATSPAYVNFSGELVSPNITSLATEGSALLLFEQDARFCCSGTSDETVSVSVSSDGGGSWSPDLFATPGLAANVGYSGVNVNGYLTAINISAYAANQANVLIRFNWDGGTSGASHYYWTIDDVCIVALPDNEIQLLSSYVVGDNNDGMEYGITPQDMQDANYTVGGQVYNFGANDHTNVVLNVTGGFTSTSTIANLPSQDTVNLETLETYGLTPAVYAGTFTLTSDQEVAGDSLFGNNTGLREFEISEASTTAAIESSVYALDGIGVYTNSTTASMGTASFAGGEDGLVIATEYRIKSASDVSGFRIMLASGTSAGGDIVCSLKDTLTFRSGDMTSLFTTQLYTVTSADVSAGFVDVFFDNVENVPVGAYYASAELYSNGNVNDIVIVDDETVAQPGNASMIYIPGDQAYGNGTASAVRLLMGNQWYVGLDEELLSGISVYPNPSEGEVTITNESGTANTVIVYDMLGNVVLSTEVSTSTTIDLSSVTGGVYVVKVSNGTASYTENVVIK